MLGIVLGVGSCSSLCRADEASVSADALEALPLLVKLAGPEDEASYPDIVEKRFRWYPLTNYQDDEYVFQYSIQGKNDWQEISRVFPINGERQIRLDQDSVKLDQKYEWRVIAYKKEKLYRLVNGQPVPVEESQKEPFARSETRTFSTPDSRDPFKEFAKDFSLRRSATDPDGKKQPATFSYAKTRGEAGSLSTEFALLGKGRSRVTESARTDGGLTLKHRRVNDAVWSLEARLDNSDEIDKNPVRLRLTRNLYTLRRAIPADPLKTRFYASHTALSLKYETNQKFDTQKLTGEVLYTPTLGNIGRFVPVPSLRFLTIRARPYLGLDFGRTLQRGDSAEEEATILRLLARVHADMQIDPLSRALFGSDDRIELFAEDSLRYLPLEDSDRTHNFFTSGLSFYFDEAKNTSFTLSFHVGKDSPEFKRDKSFTAGVGVKF
jgi:hypothetical protein